MAPFSACFICNSVTRPLFNVKGHALVKCINCSFVHVAVEPTPEELDAIYNPAYFSHSKYRDLATLHVEEMRRLKLLKQYVPASKEKRILDAGCANGNFIEVAKHEYNMFGTDYSASAVENARKLNPEIADQLAAGLIAMQNYPSAFFDAIVLWDVIEHLWNPKETIIQLRKYLKPGGYLILSTPNIGAFFAKITNKYWPFMTPPEHLSFFSKKSFHELFKQELSNMEIVKWKTQGKRTNIGFIFYKIKRIAPALVPKAIIDMFSKGRFRNLSVYVPTGDIQYLVVRK